MKKYLSLTLLLAVFYQCEPNMNYELNEQQTTRDARSGQATGKRQHKI